MSQPSEIVLSCPGGKCPVKKICESWNREGGTMMPIEPFKQEGLVFRCTYFKFKPDDKQLPTATAETKTVETKEEKKQVVEKISTEEKGTVEKVAGTQGSLFT